MVNVLRMTSPSIFRQSRLHPFNDLHRTTVQDIPDTAHHVINEWKLVTALEIEKLISSSLNKTFQLDPLDAVETMSSCQPWMTTLWSPKGVERCWRSLFSPIC